MSGGLRVLWIRVFGFRGLRLQVQGEVGEGADCSGGGGRGETQSALLCDAELANPKP